MARRRVRKPVKIVGILLLIISSVLLIKISYETLFKKANFEYKNSTSFYYEDFDNVEFILDYTNNKSFNKKLESSIKHIIDKNIDVFSNKDKVIQAKLFINNDYNLASYVFSDIASNVEEVYGSLIFDINNKELINENDIFYDDLKGLSMLSRAKLKEDESLTYKRETYTKTVPEINNFENIYFSENQVNIAFTRNKLDVDKYKTISFDYLEIMPYFNDQILKRLDKEYTRPDLSNIRYINPDKKMIAITFDDGPTTTTSVDIANYFHQNDASLTFFWLGERIENNKEIVKNIFDLNHEIANHSYNHPNFNLLSDEQLKAQSDDVSDMIRSITNQKRVLVRPPYGSANESVRSKINSPLIFWTVDTEDWRSRNEEMVYQHMKEYMLDGSIVLLHDLYETSTNAAKRILDEYKDTYEFVSVSEMFAYKGIQLEDGVLYFNAIKGR